MHQAASLLAAAGGWLELTAAHLHPDPFGWGPKGRWFKSSRPDSLRTSVRSRQVPPIPLRHAVIAIPIVLVAMVITHA
jgi:hypothetical protein